MHNESDSIGLGAYFVEPCACTVAEARRTRGTQGLERESPLPLVRRAVLPSRQFHPSLGLSFLFLFFIFMTSDPTKAIVGTT